LLQRRRPFDLAIIGYAQDPVTIPALPSPSKLRTIGRVMLPLAERFPEFVHRRVTTFELEQAEFARVRESVDFTLSPATLGELTLAGVGTFIPFGWLARGALTGFDLRHGSSPVSMISAWQLLEITQGLIADAAATPNPKFQVHLAGLVEQVDQLHSDPAKRLKAITDFERMHRSSLPRKSWDRVRRLLDLLVESYLAVAVLPECPKGRTILKYSYDIPLEKKRQLVLYQPTLPIPSALLSSSHHVDVKFPAELRAAVAERVHATSGDPIEGLEEPTVDARPNVDRVAFYTKNDEIADTNPAVSVLLALEPGAFPLPALVTAVALLVLMTVGWIRDPASLEATATAILFAASSALTALAQRAPTSPLVQRLVVAPRVALVSAGLSVLAAGASVGMTTGQLTIHIVWTAALVVTWFCVLVLIQFVVAALPRTSRESLATRGARRGATAVGLVYGLLFVLIGFNPLYDLSRQPWHTGAWIAAAVVGTLLVRRQVHQLLTDRNGHEKAAGHPAAA
jgi:hypothetical protein